MRGSHKEFLKQSMMIEMQNELARNSSLFECILSVLIVFDFLAFPYSSAISLAWNHIKSLILHRQS